MSFETESRTIVERVLREQLGEYQEVAWSPPSGRAAVDARVPGRGSRSAELLVSAGRVEVRFSRPARTAELEGDYSDRERLERDVARLAAVIRLYLRGQGRLERDAGLLGVRRSLVITTPEGQWRIGPRSTTAPDAVHPA